MHRRDILKGTIAAAFGGISVQALAAAPNLGRRISNQPGDPGERLYAMLCGDGRHAKVFLDGVEEKYAVTADEAEGLVVRHVVTPSGNLAVNWSTQELLKETVRGHVRFEIV